MSTGWVASKYVLRLLTSNLTVTYWQRKLLVTYQYRFNFLKFCPNTILNQLNTHPVSSYGDCFPVSKDRNVLGLGEGEQVTVVPHMCHNWVLLMWRTPRTGTISSVLNFEDQRFQFCSASTTAGLYWDIKQWKAILGPACDIVQSLLLPVTYRDHEYCQ